MSEVVAPFVNLNGTSKDDLIEQLTEVYSKLNDVYEAMRQATPNGRDYYMGEVPYEEARLQHMRRMKTVQDLQQELETQIGMIEERRQR